MTISLGCHDDSTPRADVDAFFASLRNVSGNPDTACLIDDAGRRVYPTSLPPASVFTIAQVQEILRDVGFFPGGKIDGICGYRTRSAIRLFQEYVQSVEQRRCRPDGIFGPGTASELQRWLDNSIKADWLPQLVQWSNATLLESDGDFNYCLSFLEKVKAHRLQSPSVLIEKVSKYNAHSATRAVSDWTFDDREIHLIGIRHAEQSAAHRFDDVLVLLIKGLVFVFQASTEPGSTTNKAGAPFLVPGQHEYGFGLHQGSYHALRPKNGGVLVVRSKDDMALTEDDLQRALESNTTINIHWGGRGVARNVNNWSAGCQVVAGAGYLNHSGKVVLRHDVAINNTRLKRSGGRLSRGAYDVLTDLVIGLSNDMKNPGRVLYTLLHEEDLNLDPQMLQKMNTYRNAAIARFGEAG